MRQYFVFASSTKRVRLFTSLEKAENFTSKESNPNELWTFQGQRFAPKSDITMLKTGVYRYLTQDEKQEQSYE